MRNYLFICVVLFVSCFFIAVGGGQLQAQSISQINKIEAAWRSWLSKENVSEAALAIAYEGRIVRVVGNGVPANTKFAVASLSKAVTGACIRKLVSGGKLNLSDKLKNIKGLGLTAAMRKGDTGNITVAQLLTHASGLRPDSTQSSMPAWLYKSRPKHSVVTKAALRRAYDAGFRNQFFYNNENYAILGRIIEAVSGKSYKKFCSTKVLRPYGSKGRLSSAFGAYAAWGGWEFSVKNYLKFLNGNFGPKSAIGKNPANWAKLPLGGGSYYGMGSHFRTSGNSFNFWHFGLLCFSSGENQGAYFASWGGAWSVVTAYDLCASQSAMAALDTALWQAAHQ